MRLVIGDRRLTLEDLINITRKGYKIEISEKAYERVAAARELVDRYVKEKKYLMELLQDLENFQIQLFQKRKQECFRKTL